jgi:antibiotic biosynthesis monooxygenase (ABM) superfamily enzyme
LAGFAGLADKTSIVTVVTALVPRGGHGTAVQAEYDQAVRSITASRHHLTSLLLHQNDGISFIVSLFRSRADYESWVASPQRQNMLRQWQTHSLRQFLVFSSSCAKIEVPSSASAPRWKSFLSIWMVTLPLGMVVNSLLTWAGLDVPPLVRSGLSSGVIAATASFVVMPWVNMMTLPWRLKDAQMRIETGDPAEPPQTGPATFDTGTASGKFGIASTVPLTGCSGSR